MSRGLFSKIHELAEFLGISMDIKHADPEPASTANPETISEEVFENSVAVTEKVDTNELAKALTKDLTNIVPKVLAKAAEKVTERTVSEVPSAAKVPNNLSKSNMIPATLPLCCWHCNKSFGNLDELQKHLKNHKGELPKNSKKHKCQKCKKVK